MLIEIIALVFVMALVMEVIDSALGMMYGTILSPVLIGMGYDTLLVVPAILVSQAAGGIAGTFFHHRAKNADFNGLTHHTKIVLAIVLTGVAAVILGALSANYIPDMVLKTYIAVMVLAMGVLCLIQFSYSFKWWKIYVIGFVSSFNKSATGGGFGPLSSTGKIISGVDSKVSVATTTFAEVPICVIGFATYVAMKGFPETAFTATLIAGALLGGILGPCLCKKMDHDGLRKAVGVLAIISGLWLLSKLVFK